MVINILIVTMILHVIICLSVILIGDVLPKISSIKSKTVENIMVIQCILMFVVWLVFVGMCDFCINT